MKNCSRCGEEKDLSEFYWQKRPGHPSGGSPMSHCKDCHRSDIHARHAEQSSEQRARRLELMRARKMLALYGISVEQYDRIFDRQGGVCAICFQPETAIDHRWVGEGVRVRRLAVDHDHKTGSVRGLLCMSCNTKLGYFEHHGLFDALVEYVTEGQDL